MLLVMLLAWDVPRQDDYITTATLYPFQGPFTRAMFAATFVKILVKVQNGEEFAWKDLFRTPILSKQMDIKKGKTKFVIFLEIATKIALVKGHKGTRQRNASVSLSDKGDANTFIMIRSDVRQISRSLLRSRF